MCAANNARIPRIKIEQISHKETSRVNNVRIFLFEISSMRSYHIFLIMLWLFYMRALIKRRTLMLRRAILVNKNTNSVRAYKNQSIKYFKIIII